MEQRDIGINLLQETISWLLALGKTEKDVRWVGNKAGTYAISWAKFKKIANVWYDNGYGAQHIADDLVVVGNKWWMGRVEYDGSEGWEFYTLPTKRHNPIKFNKVDEGLWNRLETINTAKPDGDID